MLLIPPVLFAFAALLLGGSVKNLKQLSLRALWAPIAAFVVQFAASLLVPSLLSRTPWFAVFICASYACCALFALLNFRPLLFSLLALAGTLCNFAVIAANRFYMPVSAVVLQKAGFSGIPAAKQTAYIIASESTRLLPLADVIYIPIPLLEGFASVGDVLLSLAAGILVFCALRPQKPEGGKQSAQDR